MKQTRLRAYSIVACVTLTLVAATMSHVRAQSPPARFPEVASASPQALPELELIRLADTGRFDELLVRLQADPNVGANAEAGSLIRAIELHEGHRRDEAATRAEAYTKAVEKMASSQAAGKVADALGYAVEAKGQVPDPTILLEDPRTVQLIAHAVEKAAAADQAGDWLDALSLYRMLNVLYDPRSPYREQADRIAQRVRVLRIYAPARLNELYLTRAKRMGEENPEPPIAIGADTWIERLKGVRVEMLNDGLQNAATRHVTSPGYQPLMLGAIDALRIMVETDGIGETFPSLKDRTAVARFSTYLGALHDNLAARRNPVSQFDAATVVDRILAQNRRTIELPDNVVIYELAEGALRSLDEFTAIIWPYEMEQFQRATEGRFSGVGIQIARPGGRLTVVSPLPDTPAQRAGIKPGDIIARVNGQDTSNWTLDWAVHEITGEEGTPVDLTIERPGQREAIEFRLVRAQIKIQSVQGWKRLETNPNEWDYYIDQASGIGYVRVSQFIPQTPDDLDLAVQQLRQRQGINGLIIDLRFNPGGLLRKSVEVANRFIPSGPIVSTVDGDGRITSPPFRARPDHASIHVPTVVLINQGSASASEIVSGALQDYQKALVVGERTFGKGSVQDLYLLDNRRAYLKLTTQFYQLPLGRVIHRIPEAMEWGIEPDLKVVMSDRQVVESMELRRKADVLNDPADPLPAGEGGVTDPRQIIERGLDPQLETALLILKTRLYASRGPIALTPKPAPQP